MPSTSQTLVFGAQSLERYDSKSDSMTPYGKITGKTAMTDLTRSCGIEIVTTECSVDVIEQLLVSDPVQLSYSDTFLPFNAIFEEHTIPGYKGKPTYIASRLIRAWPSDKPFPEVPELDISPLYELLPIPSGMDAEASRRLSFGLIVGSKKFAMKGKEYYQSNMLELVPSYQENSFGFSATYCSSSQQIFAWHMKERGVPQVILMDGFKRIGRNHSDSYFGLKVYSLEEVTKFLDQANAAGGSPLPPSTESPASESSVAPQPEPSLTPPAESTSENVPRRFTRRSTEGDN